MSDGNSLNGRCAPAAATGLKLCVAKIPPNSTRAAINARRNVIAAPARDSDLLKVGRAIYGEAGLKQKPVRKTPGPAPGALSQNLRSARRNNLGRPSRPDGGRWSRSRSECFRQPAPYVST